MNVEISPTDKNLSEMVSITYADSQLLDIINVDGSINELDSQYPAECVRKCNENYRIAYCGSTQIAILVFDGSGKKLTGNIYNFTKGVLDFEELAIGQTLENVQDIDPKGEYLFLYTGRNDVPKISSHYTNDGHLIMIRYSDSLEIIEIRDELI